MNASPRSLLCFTLSALFALALAAPPSVQAQARFSKVELDGAIAGENIILTLRLRIEDAARGEIIPLVAGAVAPIEADLPRGFSLQREGEQLVVQAPDGWFGGSGGDARLVFAARPTGDDTWRQVRFAIPLADVRPARVRCDRPDLEVRLDGALDIQREINAEGVAVVSAFLAPREDVRIAWKTELRRLDTELVLACTLHTLATALPGALRLDHLLQYQVIQGEVSRLAIDLPDVNLLQVLGEDIQDWRVEQPDGEGPPRLLVTLGRAQRRDYRLRLICERPLPAFPSEVAFPVVVPRDVIRASGSLLIGADGAVKLQSARVSGVSQIDPAAFPVVALTGGPARTPPARPLLAYEYAAVPFDLTIRADQIVPAFSSDIGLLLRVGDETTLVEAGVQLDIREAPLAEVRLRLTADPDWGVTAVTGRQVAETDVDTRAVAPGEREIVVPFRQPIEGPALVSVRLERLSDAAQANEPFMMPRLEVVDARSRRGHLVAAADRGLRLRIVEAEALRDVHTASTPLRVEGAQYAFRFRDSAWSLRLAAERATPAVHAEVLHLTSLGAGIAYGSAAMTCHVSGAPLQAFRFHVPADLANLDVVGPGIDSWTRSNDVCTVRLTRRVLGDVTLLLTYDQPFDYAGAELQLGRIATLDTDSEMGFIVVASAAGIALDSPAQLAPSLIRIPRDELPAGYAAAITTPILASFRYLRHPGVLPVRVTPLPAAALIDQVVEIATLHSRVSRGGEIVTTARYDIKNATRQFLRLLLPEGAALWSVRRIDENGVLSELAAQQTQNPRELLVPVERPRDPDRSLGIQIVYAQSLPARGLIGRVLRGYRLDAPQLPQTHAAFLSWTIEATDHQGLRVRAPGLQPRPRRLQRGWRMILREGAQLAGALLDGPGGRRIRLPQRIDPQASRLMLDRTLTVADDTPPQIKARLQPSRLGAGSWPLALGGALLGLALLAAAIWRRSRLTALFGALVLLTALAELPVGPFVAALLIGGGLLLVALKIVRTTARRWLRQRPRATSRQDDYADGGTDVDLPPLVANGDGAPPARQHPPTASSPPETTPADPPTPPDADDDATTDAAGDDRRPLPDAAAPSDSARPNGASGYILPALTTRLAVLSGLLLFGRAVLAGAAAPAPAEPAAPLPPSPALTRLALSIEAPDPTGEGERSAAVRWQMTFDDAEPGRYALLPPGTVMLTPSRPLHRHLRLHASPQGYQLEVLHAGDYRIDLSTRHLVAEQGGGGALTLSLPSALFAEARLRVPAAEFDITCDQAATLDMEGAPAHSEARMALIAAPAVTLRWQPRARRTTLEERLFFSEAHTLAEVRPGVMDIATRIVYHIARGEMREFHVRLPPEVTVTAVTAPGLAAWSFDPAARRLEAILDRPVTSRFELDIALQAACEALPATLTLGAPWVEGAERQSGALAIAAPETLQLRPVTTEGLTPFNTADVRLSPAATDADGTPIGLRRAYRYEHPDAVALTFEAEPVPSELRVVEAASLSLSDERTVLSSALTLTVAKAGRFGLPIVLPEGFDLESLTGPDIGQWTEARDGTNTVNIVFSRRILGETRVNVVAARAQRGIPSSFELPRLSLPDAVRHTGRQAVSAERGVRLTVAEHRGAVPRRESEDALRREDVLLFEILRPGWTARLQAQVLDPVLKPTILHRVELAEGMLQHQVSLRYRIENAGIKHFRLVLPLADVPPTVSGPQVARVLPIAGLPGGWEIELHGRVEDQYAFLCTFNQPYDPARGGVTIEPVVTLDTDPVAGYLVVTGEGRVQVGIDGTPEGLVPEDARGIPDLFQAGDLSSALHAFRIVRPRYRLELAVVRHRAADVLPATVRSVAMTSVLSPSGRLLTHLRAEISPGRLRTLRLALPDASHSELWTVRLNDGEVNASRGAEAIHIPLAAAEGADAVIDLVILSRLDAEGIIGRQEIEAPRFIDLPQADISWRVFVPPGFRYSRIGGDLEPVAETAATRFFSLDSYQAATRSRRAKALDMARFNLIEASALIEAGRQSDARRALQQTLNVSQAETDLNEDARVQMRNVVQEQVAVGLLNRRDALRASRNIYLPDAPREQAPQEAYKGGDFTPEYARRLQEGLSAQERGALDAVAARFMDQQIAAAQAVPAIAVTLPEHGRELRFQRALQTERGGALTLKFDVHPPRFAFLRALFE